MTLNDLSELLQNDLCCILDEQDDGVRINACQAVIDRIDEYRIKVALENEL